MSVNAAYWAMAAVTAAAASSQHDQANAARNQAERQANQ